MLVLVATVIPVLLFALHFVTTPVTVVRLRSAIIDYYVEIGSLESQDQAVAAVRRFGAYLRRMRRWYLWFFVLAAAMCFLSSVYGTATEPREQSEKALLTSVKLDLDAHFYLSRTLVMRREVAASYFFHVGPSSCLKLKDIRPFLETKMGQYGKLQSFIKTLTDTQLSEIFVISESISDLYVFITILVAVLISTRLTIFVMERLATSRILIGLAVLVSIAVAILSPFFVIETTLYVASSSGVALFGTVPDFYDLDVPTVANFGFSLANVLTVLTMAPETLLHVIFLKFDFGSWLHAVLFGAYSIFVLPMMSVHFAEFIKQARQFNAFDFNIAEMSGIRNWGLFTDLAFSASYVVVAYLLRLAAARSSVREYLLKFLQEIDSDTQGPFMSLAGKTKLLFAASLALITGH